MSPFITIEDIYEKLDQVLLLCCCSGSQRPMEYYEGSLMVVVDDITTKFINSICSIEVPENKTLVCYDSGDLQSASKVYWALRASGFSEVKVMPRSIYSSTLIPLKQGSPQPVPKSEKPYLPFNNELVMTKEEFLKRETFYQQAVQINYLAFNLLDSSGKLQEPEVVLNFLLTSGVKFTQNRASIVHGKKACLGGVVLAYVSKRSVSVVIDEIESLGIPQIKDSRTREYKLNKTDDSDEVKYNTMMGGYSITIDDLTSRTVKKPLNTRETGQCRNCVIY